MLAVSWDTIRVFLHVLAATVWVGGQITLTALVPVLRRLGAELPRAAARRFSQVAWPAFAVLVITGIWNIIAVRPQINGSYETTLVVKLIVVAISGISAATGLTMRDQPQHCRRTHCRGSVQWPAGEVKRLAAARSEAMGTAREAGPPVLLSRLRDTPVTYELGRRRR
jgi:putative copper export protein